MERFHEYQDFVGSTVAFRDPKYVLDYFALKLNGEAGEVAEKIGKLWRNKGITEGDKISPEDRLAIIKELGDSLWYITAIAKEINSSLGEVASCNVAKLMDRQERGVICSEGDNR